MIHPSTPAPCNLPENVELCDSPGKSSSAPNTTRDLSRHRHGDPPAGVHVRQAACIIDQDNLLHLDGPGRYKVQAQLDVFAFANALRARGVTQGTICRNWDFTAFEEQLWHQFGFRVSAARSNCDAQVIISAILYVEAGFRDLVLVAGDGDYAHAVKMIRRCGVRVEIWSRRRTMSAELRRAADHVHYIDKLLRIPD